MRKQFILLIVCSVLSGCGTTHYSDRVASELREARVKCSQLQRGMRRSDVETILSPIPSSGLGFEWNISGIVSVSYQLYPGIQVAVEYGASTGTLLMVPHELSVNLNSRDKETRHLNTFLWTRFHESYDAVA